MAEKIISPGVFTNEVDQSFLPAGVAAIGAAIIGPTAKGPAGIPTQVTSYSEFVQVFGGAFTSGSAAVEGNYKYLTNYAAQEYLKYADTLTVVRILAGTYNPAESYVTQSIGLGYSFRLTTLADGAILNSGLPSAVTLGKGLGADQGLNGVLISGSANNLRWEVSNVNNAKGTFTLAIRRGDDTNRRKTIVEQFSNLTLDPNSPNYISRVIGDQVYTLRDSGTGDPFLQLSGSFPNKSSYVRVSEVKSTLNYLDSNGRVRVGAASASLPAAVSGTFANGSDGNVIHPISFFETISDTNTQGFNLANGNEGLTSYIDA